MRRRVARFDAVQPRAIRRAKQAMPLCTATRGCDAARLALLVVADAVDVRLPELLAELGEDGFERGLELRLVGMLDDLHALGAEVGDGLLLVAVDARAIGLHRGLRRFVERLLVGRRELVPL